jgi:hypothetical protein
MIIDTHFALEEEVDLLLVGQGGLCKLHYMAPRKKVTPHGAHR